MCPEWAHRPVLLEETLALLAPQGRGILFDATIGLGGHSEALLELAGREALLIGTDADEENLRLAKQRLSRFAGRARFFHANFAQLREVLDEASVPAVDLFLADLGISSNQLDDPRRGLSFSVDGPLDMRLDSSIQRTAADLINTLGERELADLIFQFGQERYSRRIARAIAAARVRGRIERTQALADLVYGAYPAAARRQRRGVHPATRTFQALRIAVNDEMGSLDRLLEQLPGALAPGGRAGIISFHSLEDGRVKRAFAAWAAAGLGRLVVKKPVSPSEEEAEKNPRSRSAKLRVFEKTVK